MIGHMLAKLYGALMEVEFVGEKTDGGRGKRERAAENHLNDTTGEL